MTIKQGPIKLGADVAAELGLPVTGKLTLGDARVRALAGKPSGPLKLSDLNGKSAYPPAGTLLSTFCSGFNKMGRYANGSGGTYDQLIQANSAECGYAPGQFTIVAGRLGTSSTGYPVVGYLKASGGSIRPSPPMFKGYEVSGVYYWNDFLTVCQVSIFGNHADSLVQSISINGVSYTKYFFGYDVASLSTIWWVFNMQFYEGQTYTIGLT